MVSKLIKSTALLALVVSASNASDFNKQAEKDRKALVKYFEAKFTDPLKDRVTFFPYSTDDELKNNIMKNLKFEDFSKGNYAFSKNGRVSYDEIKEFPPYEEFVEKGEELYEKKFANGKSFKDCFPKTDIAGEYPYFDDKRKEVVTLTQAINECRTANGEKAWKTTKGKIAHLEAYFAYETQEAEKKVDIKIPSEEAAKDFIESSLAIAADCIAAAQITERYVLMRAAEANRLLKEASLQTVRTAIAGGKQAYRFTADTAIILHNLGIDSVKFANELRKKAATATVVTVHRSIQAADDAIVVVINTGSGLIVTAIDTLTEQVEATSKAIQ